MSVIAMVLVFVSSGGTDVLSMTGYRGPTAITVTVTVVSTMVVIKVIMRRFVFIMVTIRLGSMLSLALLGTG
jgi:hypothetical protein